MRRGRYNILLQPNNIIKKFNVYMNDYCNLFIFFEGSYQMIEKLKRYKGGWLWILKEIENGN